MNITLVTRVAIKQCPKCGGTLSNGWYEDSCLNCGKVIYTDIIKHDPTRLTRGLPRHRIVRGRNLNRRG